MFIHLLLDYFTAIVPSASCCCPQTAAPDPQSNVINARFSSPRLLTPSLLQIRTADLEKKAKKEHHPFVRNSVSKTPREKKKKPRGEKARMDQRGAKGRRRGSRGLKKLFCQGGGQQSLIDDDCPLCNRSHWQIYNLP